jgi:Flp pilus assembly pilin Flp
MLKKNHGQGLVEYLILLCLVAVSSIAVVSVVGQNIKAQYAKISNAITGRGANIEMVRPSQDAYKIRGMDNYTDSARTLGQ